MPPGEGGIRGNMERKEKLRALEDARLAFAEEMAQRGFEPDEMILVGTERGALVGLSRERSRLNLVIGPEFVQPGPFRLESCPLDSVRREEVLIPSEGLGGLLGMGKKGAKGFVLILDRGGVEISVPFITNRTSASCFSLRKNPLLKRKRRHGDANVLWDLNPLDDRQLHKIEKKLESMIRGDGQLRAR